jgi:oligopeptide/dipeptide ABC transporter ATP-binding protein
MVNRPMPPLLEVIDLKTLFPTDQGNLIAVNEVTFSVERGEIVGIVGESGSGKSMTARSMLRIVPPPGQIVSGRVLLNGEDLLALPESAMRRARGGKLGMIFQEPGAALDPVFTVGDQIIEAITLHRGINGPAARRMAEDYFAQVGIPDPRVRLNAYPHELSGGTQQRVTIAIALACLPQLLIADEPTTALDVTIQAQILELLVGLTTNLGLGLIFITHNIAAVAQIAKRILVMYAGRIVEEGRTDQIIDSPEHPYTQALIRAMPTIGAKKGQRLFEIAGRVPDLSRLPAGCAFHPRCPQVMDQCRTEVPSLEKRTERRISCWLTAPSQPVSQPIAARNSSS